MPENTATDSGRSFDHSELVAQIAIFCEEWNTAEEWIKKGEHFNGAVVFPSINELRYAGRRLVVACAAAQHGDAAKAEKSLLEAGENLAKARHDVVDAMIDYVSREANRIRNAVGAGYLQKHFRQYEELFGLLKTMAAQTVKSRGDRTDHNKIYEDMMRTDLPALEKMYNALEASLPAIQQNRIKDRFKMGCIVLGSLASIAASFVSVVMLFK